jgi:hypothetical protein
MALRPVQVNIKVLDASAVGPFWAGHEFCVLALS